MENNSFYRYKAFVESVYDADTVTLLIDVGFKTFRREKVRLYGIDTPEIKTKDLKEKRLGLEARDFLRDLILLKDVTIETLKQGKFGRYLVKIWIGELYVNDKLIELGYAKEYFGGKR